MRTEHTDCYYTSLDHIIKVFDNECRKLGFNANTIKEFEKWKYELREKLKEISGINKAEKCELSSKLLESVDMGGYRRDKIILQTEPNVWMPLYILIPNDIKHDERRKCIITPHGHCGGGKASVAGRSDILAIKEQIEIYNYDYGVQFVNRGYIVFCPDARGFGERREWNKQSDNEQDYLASTCAQLNNLFICLGRSVIGMWVWDLIKLIDYIEQRDDCDKGKIACAGLSGGGMQTMWLAALDERIKCCAISGYFYGYKDALLKLSDNCSCNYVPNLWEYADMGDFGALIAPRAVLIESGTKDHLNGERGIENVIEQVDISRKAYKIFNCEERIVNHIFEDEHVWNGEKTYPFIEKWINE